MESDLALTLVLFTVFFLAMFYVYYKAQQRIKRQEEDVACCERNCERNLFHYNFCRQENDVWSISGRVNTDNWPTHDHHISIESYVFPPEYQSKDPRYAPPPYSEVDLPTYEEAITARGIHKTLPVPVHTIQIQPAPLESA